jgi:hypothetical protein
MATRSRTTKASRAGGLRRVWQMAPLPLNLGRNLFPPRRFSYRPAIQRVQATNGCRATLHLPGGSRIGTNQAWP